MVIDVPIGHLKFTLDLKGKLWIYGKIIIAYLLQDVDLFVMAVFVMHDSFKCSGFFKKNRTKYKSRKEGKLF